MHSICLIVSRNSGTSEGLMMRRTCWQSLHDTRPASGLVQDTYKQPGPAPIKEIRSALLWIAYRARQP